MSKTSDKSFYESKFARRDGDAYYTDAWVTEALLDAMRKNGTPLAEAPGVIWEPAAGRGDMARILAREGEVFCSDVNLDDLDPCEFDRIEQLDFLKDAPGSLDLLDVGAIVTNPPFFKNYAAKFLKRALDYEPTVTAVLVRLEFASGRTRTTMFERDDYAFELKLTSRPRWDWWFRDEPEAEPRHYYSWHVWDKRTIGQKPVIYRAMNPADAGKREREKVNE